MAILDVVHYGDPILKKVCEPVTDFSSINVIIDDMFESMYEAEGIGLAANQVGLDMNLFIIDITHTDDEEEIHIFINSTIIDTFGEKEEFQEGCLSLPGIALDVIRPEKVRIKYQSMDEQWHESEYDGLLARAIQHEMDHLNGVFIVDRVGEIERIKYQAELKALEKSSRSRMALTSKKGFVL